jgi:hypothetical protein
MAVDAVAAENHGSAAGLLTTFQNLGGALGLAVAAAALMLQGIPVHLFSGNSGCSLHRGILANRVEELRNRFGDLVVTHVVQDISGAFRSIAIENLESGQGPVGPRSLLACCAAPMW